MAASADNYPAGQLPDDATPTRYAINLTVVPDQETFAGKVVIDVKLAKTTDLIWLKPARPRALAGRCNG